MLRMSAAKSGGCRWRAMNMSISKARSSGSSRDRTASEPSSLMSCLGLAQCWRWRAQPAPYRIAGDAAVGLALPAEPCANCLAHDQLLVGFRYPGDFLKVAEALPPRARHLGDVGAPKQSAGPESVVHGAVVLVQTGKWIGVVGVERAAGQLDGHVRQFSKRRQFGHVWKRRLALGAPKRAHMIDDQLQAGMPSRDFTEQGQPIAREQSHGQLGSLGRRPEPVQRTIHGPRPVVWLVEIEP